MKTFLKLIIVSIILSSIISSCGNKRTQNKQETKTEEAKTQKQRIADKYIKMAEEINKQTPIEMMNNIQLDKAEALDDNIFKYYYTFNEEPKTTSDIFIKITKPTIVAMLQNAPEMKEMKNDRITIIYIYYKKDKSLFAEIKVSPEEY